VLGLLWHDWPPVDTPAFIVAVLVILAVAAWGERK